MMQTASEAASQLAWDIMLPSRLGKALGPRVIGRPYIPYPWVEYVEVEILEMLQRPGREVLILSVPPQEGKTTFSGMWLPFWYLGMNPDNLIIFVAYNSDYAGGWGLNVRNLVEHFGPEFFNLGLNRSKQNVNDWRTSKGFGGMLSAGIDGGITGNPGHFIIIDDVIKNMKEAGSPTIKKGHLDEWDGSISARFQENTKVLITATRWAEDDLSGEIYARSIAKDYEGIPVRMIKIKAFAEPEEGEDYDEETWRDCLGRKKGEALKGQHSAEFFREKKASVSNFVWNSLYMADPTAREGSMFPPDQWGWFDPDLRPDMIDLRRCWDVAATENDGDYTVGTKFGKASDGRIYVLDVQRFRKATSGVRDEVLKSARIDGFGCPIRMEQERSGAGKSVVAGYEEDLAGYDFEGIRPDGSKVSRYTNYSDLQQRGHILLPKHANGTTPEWVDDWIKEHKLMYDEDRKPRHDDQIDTGAMAINEMYGSGVIEIRDPMDTVPELEDELDDLAFRHDLTLVPEMPPRLAALLGRTQGGSTPEVG